MTQHDQYQSAPPPAAYPTEQQPVYGQPGYQPQKTNTMAILGLVFAFVFSPLGIVFSAIGLKQIKQRREGGRGLALAGLILSIVFLRHRDHRRDPRCDRGFAGSAVEQAQVRRRCPWRRRPTTRPAWSPRARSSCPRSWTWSRDLATVQTPEDYATVMTGLAVDDGGRGRADDRPHVHRARADAVRRLPAGRDAVSAGEDPSTLEGALTADGTQIDNDCAAAGYVQ